MSSRGFSVNLIVFVIPACWAVIKHQLPAFSVRAMLRFRECKPQGIRLMATILIASEDTDCTDIFGAEVAALGHEVLLALTGQEACEMTLQSSPDLVLLDLQLPVFNAIETCRLLREDPDVSKNLPIFLIAKRDIDLRTLEQAGITGWISKDHAAYELHDLLARHLVDTA